MMREDVLESRLARFLDGFREGADPTCHRHALDPTAPYHKDWKRGQRAGRQAYTTAGDDYRAQLVFGESD